MRCAGIPLLLAVAMEAGLAATPEPVSVIPLPFEHPQGVVWDAGRHCFWLTNHHGGLLQADPLTRRVERVASIDPYAQGLGWDGKRLWLFLKDDPRLHGINPETGEEVASVWTSVTQHTGVAWDGTEFWVVDRCAGEAERDLIAPISGDVPDRRRATESPQPVSSPGVATTGLLWIGDQLYVSAETGRVLRGRRTQRGIVWSPREEFELVVPGKGAQGIAYDGSLLWVVDTARRELQGYPLVRPQIRGRRAWLRSCESEIGEPSPLEIAIAVESTDNAEPFDLWRLRLIGLAPDRVVASAEGWHVEFDPLRLEARLELLLHRPLMDGEILTLSATYDFGDNTFAFVCEGKARVRRTK